MDYAIQVIAFLALLYLLYLKGSSAILVSLESLEISNMFRVTIALPLSAFCITKSLSSVRGVVQYIYV